jgi:hypothetical protein
MDIIGKLLVTLTFIIGAYLASLHPTEINWLAFLPVIGLGAVGAVLVKKGQRALAGHSELLDGHRNDLQQSLDNIVLNLEQLEAGKLDIPTYEMRFEIDRLLRHDLGRFADARDSMRTLQTFADIMSSFAAGERYINRIWSASTDGYQDEVLIYVEKSLNQFHEARNLYLQASSQTNAEAAPSHG